jgi:hypothetical protein
MPHCLFCRKSWLHTFMIDTFPSSFLNGPMKTSRMDVLLNEQKAMLPTSHGDLQAELGKRKRFKAANVQREVIAEKKAALRIEEDILRTLNHPDTTGESPVRVESKQCSYKCPAANCRGFLADWQCSVCELIVCKKCLAPEGEGHECDKDAVETMRTLARDTKPCPGCGEGIMKIVGGCDQARSNAP